MHMLRKALAFCSTLFAKVGHSAGQGLTGPDCTDRAAMQLLGFWAGTDV